MAKRTDNLIRLSEALQANAEGMTLVEIQRYLRVSESTARHLLRDIEYYFGNLEEAQPTGRAKRWRVLPGATRHLVAFTPEELVELDRTEARLRKEGIADGATAIKELRRKLRLLMPQRAEDAQRPRLETLMQLEADVMRPGPRPDLPAGLLEKLREALHNRRVVTLHYAARIRDSQREINLEPHGILFGTRHYLVAFEVGKKGPTPRLYAMTNMSNVLITQRRFRPRANFDLASFASHSFGVFQEEPFQVVWRFAARRATDVMRYHFHPTERKRVLDDGSVEVTFTAGGDLEMCWHLFTWGEDVEVVEPNRLRHKYRQEIKAILAKLGED